MGWVEGFISSNGYGEVTSRTPLSGGCINEVSLLTCSGGNRIVLKENSSTHYPEMFCREAEGLNVLESVEGPRVPHVIGWHDEGSRQFLLLEYIESQFPPESIRGSFTSSISHWEKFGQNLAILHQTAVSSRGCGFENDNYIGATPQPNEWIDSWPRFFGERRLGFLLIRAQNSRAIDSSMSKSIEKLINRLPEVLPDIKPSLVHGDLWNGNIMVASQGGAVMYDPAVYYGHGEVDIAMTKLFGRLDQRFYDAYFDVIPTDSGFADRCAIYNLYHMLNHLILFGAGYLSSVKRLVARFS